MTKEEFDLEYPTKRYSDGSTGEYFCICYYCKKQFIGHKRDTLCPRENCRSLANGVSWEDLYL